jgi:hypothetical protein
MAPVKEVQRRGVSCARMCHCQRGAVERRGEGAQQRCKLGGGGEQSRRHRWPGGSVGGGKGEGSGGWSEQQGTAQQRGKAVVGRSSVAWQWRPWPWRAAARQQGERARWESEGGQRKRVRDARAARASALGGAGSRAARGAELGRAAAMKRALCCMAATAPFRRTRGERHCARLGVRFWAISAPNWAVGLEAKLFSF